MGKSTAAPPATDYTGAARTQGAENRSTAIQNAMMSNPNVTGPLGGQEVTWRDGVPTVTQRLTPESQRALEAQQRSDVSISGAGETAAGNVARTMATPFAYSGPGVQTRIGDYTKMPVGGGMTAQQAMLSRLEPTLAQARQSRLQELANQGVAQGTEAYRNMMTELGQNENDLRLQAALQGLNVDLGAQEQEYRQALANAQFGNTASEQALNRELALRNQPLREYAALRDVAPITMPNLPSFQGTTYQPAPLFNASAQEAADALNRYNAQMAQQNANTAGLYELGGAALGSELGQKAVSKLGSKVGGLLGFDKSAPLDVPNSSLPASQQGPTNVNAGNAPTSSGSFGAMAAGVPAAAAGLNAALAPAGQVLVSDASGLLSSGALNTSGLMSGIGTGVSPAATGGAANIGSTAVGGGLGALGTAATAAGLLSIPFIIDALGKEGGKQYIDRPPPGYHWEPIMQTIADMDAYGNLPPQQYELVEGDPLPGTYQGGGVFTSGEYGLGFRPYS